MGSIFWPGHRVYDESIREKVGMRNTKLQQVQEDDVSWKYRMLHLPQLLILIQIKLKGLPRTVEFPSEDGTIVLE